MNNTINTINNMNNTNNNSSNVSNVTKQGWEILEDIPGIFVKQKLEGFQQTVSYEEKNCFKIYGTDEKGDRKGNYYIFIKFLKEEVGNLI